MKSLGNFWPSGIGTIGDMVGGQYLWHNGVLTGNLNTMVVSGSGWTLIDANGINDAGQIVGTGLNPGGQTRAFLLTPLVAPLLTLAVSQPNGEFRFTLVGEVGCSYTIQASTNLVNWIAVTNFVSATGTNQFTDVIAPNFNRRFYRAITP